MPFWTRWSGWIPFTAAKPSGRSRRRPRRRREGLTLGYNLTRDQIGEHYASFVDTIYDLCRGRQMVLVKSTPDFRKKRWKPRRPDQILKAVDRSLSRSGEDQQLSTFPALHATIEREVPGDGVSYDLVIDIDAKQSHGTCKEATSHAIAFLEDREVPMATKFSGGVGYHVIIPGEAFPRSIDGHLMSEIFPKVGEAFHRSIISVLLEKMGATLDRGIKVDTSMSRPDHLLRAPYSIHESTGLVSQPLTPEMYVEFVPKDAMLHKAEVLKGWWPDVSGDGKLAELCSELEWWKFRGEKRSRNMQFVFPTNPNDLQKLRDAFQRDINSQKRALEAQIRALRGLQDARISWLKERIPFTEREERISLEKGVVREIHIGISTDMGSLAFLPSGRHRNNALDVVVTGRSNGHALEDRWVGDFARKVETKLEKGSATCWAHYARDVYYTVDFNTVTGTASLRIALSQPLRKARLSTVTGKVIIGWNQASGEPYVGMHEGVVEVESQAGTVTVEGPLESLGVSIIAPVGAKRRVNRDNWNERPEGSIESWGYGEAPSKYRIRIAGQACKLRLS